MYKSDTYNKDLVSCEEALRILRISARTLDTLIKNGRLRSALYSEVKSNQPRVFYRQDIERLRGGTVSTEN